MSQFGELARPKMSTATSLQADDTRLRAGKERENLSASELPTKYRLPALVDAMHLEPALRRVRGDDYGGRLTTTTMAGWGSLRPT